MKQKLEKLGSRNALAEKLLSVALRIASLRYSGQNVCCPVCETSFSTFLPGGQTNDRLRAKCPRCRALERHRAVWYFLSYHEKVIQKANRLLFVAPEYGIRRALDKQAGLKYTTIDLADPRSQIQMDVTRLAFSEGSFDSLLCMHVLEHVNDDLAAMAEFYRVLSPGGWAVIQVPVSGKRTIENASIVTADQRLRAFGQEDHVRQYGADFPQRLEQSGFDVRVVNLRKTFSNEAINYYGLLARDLAEDIYFCTKPR